MVHIRGIAASLCLFSILRHRFSGAEQEKVKNTIFWKKEFGICDASFYNEKRRFLRSRDIPGTQEEDDRRFLKAAGDDGWNRRELHFRSFADGIMCF